MLESLMEPLLALLMGLLGTAGPTTVLALGVIVAIANLVGKMIPDSATGWLAIVRKIAKVIGLYVGNRVTKGVSTNDVGAAIVATVPDSSIKAAAKSLPDAVRVGTAAGNVARDIMDVARGLEPGRPYEPGVSPEPGSTVPEEFRTDR